LGDGLGESFGDALGDGLGGGLGDGLGGGADTTGKRGGTLMLCGGWSTACAA